MRFQAAIMEEKRSKEIVVKKGNQKVRNLKDVVNPRRCRRRRSIFRQCRSSRIRRDCF